MAPCVELRTASTSSASRPRLPSQCPPPRRGVRTYFAVGDLAPTQADLVEDYHIPLVVPPPPRAALGQGLHVSFEGMHVPSMPRGGPGGLLVGSQRHVIQTSGTVPRPLPSRMQD